MDCGGGLARCPGHAPVGDQRHLLPASLHHGHQRVQRVQFGHAVGLGPLKPHHDHTVVGQGACLERGLDLFLVVEHAGRGLDQLVFIRNGRDFDHPAPKIAVQLFKAPLRCKGITGGAQDTIILAVAWGVLPADFAVDQFGFLRVVLQAVAHDSDCVRMQKARVQQFADHIGQPTRRVKMVHVGQPVGIDARHQRCRVRDVGEVLQVKLHARGAGHGDDVDHQIGRSARRHQPHQTVHKGALVQNITDGAVIIAQVGDFQRAFGARMGQRIAQVGVGVHERRTGQVQAHELHQHLVGIGGAVERAGARTVIGCHLGLHQLVAAHFASGVLLADLGFLLVRQARGHRPRRQKDRGDVAKGRGGNDQPRHDLVANTKINRTVKGVVRQRHTGGQRDDVARKQRQLHARLPLGHAVAHGGYAPRNLCGAAVGQCGLLDQIGEPLERLVR